MNVNEYQTWAIGKWFAGENLSRRVGRRSADQIVSAFGIGGEAGEFLEKVKKELRGDPGITIEDKIKELGDILFYIAIYANACDIPLSEVFNANILKLDDRHERGKMRGDGDNR